MTIHTRLLTYADIERQLLSRTRHTDVDESDSVEEIGICPIVELLELCEWIKKGKIKASLISFREGMQAFQDNLVRTGKVIVIDLDQNCLAHSLFEWDDDYTVTGLWAPAVADRQITLTHSVRRLLLRPSDQTWWNGDIYAEAEDIYGNIEPLY